MSAVQTRAVVAACFALGLAASTTAFASEPVSTSSAAVARDDDIFSGTSSAGTASDLEGDAVFDGERPRDDDGAMATAVAKSNDYLDIGGQLWLWFEYDALSRGPAESFRLRSPSFVELYADARPVEHVRAFTLGRVSHDFTVSDDTRNLHGEPEIATKVDLDQLWLTFDIENHVFVTAGRQRVRWGTGRFWNPTDFLNRQRRDPLSPFDRRLGVGLVQVHVPFEEQGLNLRAVANVEGADAPAHVGGAFRAELVVGPGEIAISAAMRKDDATRLGADLSFGVWLFDLALECAISHQEKAKFYRGPFDIEGLVFPSEYSRKDDWIPQLVASAEIAIPFGDEDSVVLSAEYFFNEAGTNDSNLYPVLLYTERFVPLYVGRHYVAAAAMLRAPGRWDDTTFLLSGIGNLSDRSFVARFDYSVRVYDHLDVKAYGALHFGDEGELKLAIDVPPVAIIPELEQGLSVAPPLAELGLVLALAL